MAPDYKRNDPRGWCGDPRRGAALGRPTIETNGYAGMLHLRSVSLNSGGYDRNGTYFGHGDPLFWVASPDGTSVDYVIRAKGRAEAKATVREQYPDARFYR